MAGRTLGAKPEGFSDNVAYGGHNFRPFKLNKTGTLAPSVFLGQASGPTAARAYSDAVQAIMANLTDPAKDAHRVLVIYVSFGHISKPGEEYGCVLLWCLTPGDAMGLDEGSQLAATVWP